MKTLVDTSQPLFVSLFYFVIFAFLSSESFRNNYMHCEIIDHYFGIFVEIQLKEENLKYFSDTKSSAPKLVHTSLPNDLSEYVTSIFALYIVFHNIFYEIQNFDRTINKYLLNFFKIIFLLIFPLPIFL